MPLSPFAESLSSWRRSPPTDQVRMLQTRFPLSIEEAIDYRQAGYWYHKACAETSGKCALAVGNDDIAPLLG
jgi:hypothetical protein